MKTKMTCFCGCASFTVLTERAGPNKTWIMFRCEACQCLRQVSSPGYSADYVISPAFAVPETAAASVATTADATST